MGNIVLPCSGSGAPLNVGGAEDDNATVGSSVVAVVVAVVAAAASVNNVSGAAVAAPSREAAAVVVGCEGDVGKKPVGGDGTTTVRSSVGIGHRRRNGKGDRSKRSVQWNGRRSEQIVWCRRRTRWLLCRWWYNIPG